MTKTKFLVLIFIFTILMLAFPNIVSATTIEVTETTTTSTGITVKWSYELDDNNNIIELTCTNKEEVNGKLEIPSKIDGYTVKTIGIRAFSNSKYLNSVLIPDTVTTLENMSFLGCTSLKNITIPSTVIRIEDDAFGGCTSLTICGQTDSYAKLYAEANSINFAGLYSVTNTFTNITSDGNNLSCSGWGDYTATLSASDGYKLPETIIVKVGENKLSTKDYTYTISEDANGPKGNLIINSSAITGNIEIIAEANLIPEYTVTINPVDGATITPNGVIEGAIEGS